MSNQGALAWWRRDGPVSQATAIAYRLLRHGAPNTSTGDVTSFGLCRCPGDAGRKSVLGTRETRRVGSHFLPGTLLPSNRPPPPSFAPPPASSNTWFRRLPGPGRGDIGARTQTLHSQVVPGARAQGARGGLQDARAGGRGGAEGTALGVRGPGACWVGSRAEELGTRTPPGRPGELWAVAGHRMGLRRRANHRDFNAAWCRDVLVCFILFYFVRKQTNGLGKCRCCSWRSIVFEYGYMQFIFRGRGEITLTLTVPLE